jgi:CheY-like chemotaxis protein
VPIDILSFSRAGFSRHIVVDINQRLREALGVVQQTLGPSSTVELDLDDGLPEVSLDPVQFDLALLNLAANARDAMPTPGTLRISSRAVAALDGKPSVTIAVSDPGTGIPPGVLKRVFEPFFTTKGIGEGSGLGLTQVYGFAQNAGGVAQIDSRPGAGTTVTIILPGASEPGVVGAPAPGAAEPPKLIADPTASSSPAGRILLVDDNEAVRSVTAAYLRDCGFAVAEAADATSAIGLLQQSTFEAIVSDIVMPGAIDGLGLAREVGRRWPLTPLILISGYAKSLADAGSIGVRIVAKPFAPVALADVIRQEMDVAVRASRALG